MLEKRARKTASVTGGVFKGILGAQLVSRGIGMASLGIGVATREMIRFDHAATAAGAKFGPAFARGTAGFAQIGKVARQVGATTEFSAAQAADGLDFLAKAGFSAVQSMALLPGVTDLATGAQSDFARAADIASDTLGAFNLNTTDTAQLGINFNRVMDRMAKTATTTNTDLETMFESIVKGAPDFTNAGQSMETFLALTGKLANAGKKGAEAGTALRNMVIRLAKPTGEAGDVIDSLGIKTRDSKGNFLDMIGILGQFEVALKGKGTAERSAAITTVFGARAMTSVNILLNEGKESLEEYRGVLLRSDGAIKQLAESMRKSLQNRLLKLQSTAIELGLKFFDVFGPKIESGIGKVQTMLDGLNTNFKNTVAGVTEIATSLGWLATAIKWAGGAWLIYKGAMVASMVITQASMLLLRGQLVGLAIYSAGVKAVAIATKIAAVAQGAFNFVMSANPIGLAIIGIAALTAGVILLIENFDTVKNAAKSAWEWISGGVKSAVGFNPDATFGEIKPTLTTPATTQAKFGGAGSGVLRSEHTESKSEFLQMIPPEGWGVEKVPNVGLMSTLPLGDSP
jgi:TP901 family phage tail tape measure protein